MKKILSTAFVAASLSCGAQAGVSFLIDGEVLADSAGAPISSTSLVLLVASTSDALFSNLTSGSISVGSLFGDDQIVWRGDLSGFPEPGVLSAATGNLNFSGNWGATDRLALIWFPTLTLGSTELVGGESYGIYTNINAIDGSAAWVTPADGVSNYNLLFYTSNGANLGTGTNAPSAGFASLTVPGVVIPEPSSFAALAGLGILGVVATRRRRSA